jgi:hypothetical protein
MPCNCTEYGGKANYDSFRRQQLRLKAIKRRKFLVCFAPGVSDDPDIGRGLTNRSATCKGDRRRRKRESRHINVTLTI